MVKQFTIPCQFGQETSPVTLYIGHPEETHHPVHFQSAWLSSTKGGTIPQDLMNTLQKLHDLANENGADFEELCYYALISATQHGIGGATPEDISRYADEFVRKEGNVETPVQDATSQTQSEEEKQFGATATKTQEEQKKDAENLDKLKDVGNNEPKEAKKANEEGEDSMDNQAKTEKIQPTLSVNTAEKKEPSLNPSTNDNNTANSQNANSTQQNTPEDKKSFVEAYTAEDEDLLLEDDLLSF